MIMFTRENPQSGHGKNVDKWVAMNMIQRAEQIYHIAEMLDATMQDLSEQMDTMSDVMGNLEEATEVIREKMEEMADMMSDDFKPDDLLPPTSEPEPLPF